MNAEGWYKDPYGHHEERWFSDGVATKLVRDGQVEGADPPPDFPPPEPLVPPEPHGAVHGAEDLRRADDAEREGRSAQPLFTRVSEAEVAPTLPRPDQE